MNAGHISISVLGEHNKIIYVIYNTIKIRGTSSTKIERWTKKEPNGISTIGWRSFFSLANIT